MAESILENVVPETNNKNAIPLPHRSGFRSSNRALQKSEVVEPSTALVAQEAAAAVPVIAAEAAAAIAILPAHLVVRLEVDDLLPDEGMRW